jgi:hypothetical protein
MPYKTEKIRFDDVFLDRRNKLLPCQEEQMKWWYSQGSSIHSLSRMFRISRRLIQFKLFPERHKQNLKLRQERGGSKIYYDKDSWKDTMKEHRKYKHRTLKKTI